MEEIGDWILLSLAVTVSLPFIFANFVILSCRKRKYFKAQGGVDLILIGSVAGLVWIVASFVVDGHFKRRGIFHSCILWTFWLKHNSFCLWLVCIILRLHRMHLLSRGSDGLSWKHCLWIPLLMLPAILVSLLATEAGAFDDPKTCRMKWDWRMSMYFTATPVYFSGMLIFLFILRGTKDPILATEYRHSCEYSVMAFIIYVLLGVNYLSGGSGHVEGRCFVTFCVCCLVFFHFWVRMWWPVYMCLFRPETEMDEFENRLRQSGAQIFRVLSGHGALEDEGAVWQAITEATEEVESLKNRIKAMETTKQELQYKVHLLQQLQGAALRSPPSITAGELVEESLQNGITYIEHVGN